MSGADKADVLPETMTEALDSLERDVHSLAVAQQLKQRNLSAESARQAVRGLKAYLGGDVEQAAQLFEALAEDLRDHTVTIGEG